MLAQEQADLVGWKWHPGYQSHFETTAGTLIPTCNVWPGTCTAEDMLEAEVRQLAMNIRIDKKNKETMRRYDRLHGRIT